MLYLKDYHDIGEQKVCITCKATAEEVRANDNYIHNCHQYIKFDVILF